MVGDYVLDKEYPARQKWRVADLSEPPDSKGSWRGLPALIGGLVGGVGVGLLLNVTANAIDPSRVPFILHWGWFGLALYFPLYLIYISPARNWVASSWHHTYKKWIWLAIGAVFVCIYAWTANTVITNAWKGLAPQSAIPQEPKAQPVPHSPSSPVLPEPVPVTPPTATSGGKSVSHGALRQAGKFPSPPTVYASGDRQKQQQIVIPTTPAPPTRLEPGQDPYRNVSDVQVAQWASEEADKLDDLSDKAMTYWGGPRNGVSVNALIWRFTNEFKDCCAQDLKDLREELFRRLGPPAKDPEDASSWEMMFLKDKYPMIPDRTISPSLVKGYTPHLRKLALQLRRRAIPRIPPRSLRFTQQSLQSDEKTNPLHYKSWVTVEISSVVQNGFIVVQFDKEAGSMGSDVEGSTVIMGSDRDLVENPDLKKLLSASAFGRTYVVKIGHTPITKAIHFAVSGLPGAPDVRVISVTLYDE